MLEASYSSEWSPGLVLRRPAGLEVAGAEGTPPSPWPGTWLLSCWRVDRECLQTPPESRPSRHRRQTSKSHNLQLKRASFLRTSAWRF